MKFSIKHAAVIRKVYLIFGKIGIMIRILNTWNDPVNSDHRIIGCEALARVSCSLQSSFNIIYILLLFTYLPLIFFYRESACYTCTSRFCLPFLSVCQSVRRIVVLHLNERTIVKRSPSH